MKKLFLFLTFALVSTGAKAAWMDSDLVNRSSFTQANPTTLNVNGVLPGDVLRGVILPAQTHVTVAVYDSSRTATNRIGNLATSTSTAESSTYIPFNVRLSSGLSFTITNNTSGVSFIWLKTKPE